MNLSFQICMLFRDVVNGILICHIDINGYGNFNMSGIKLI